MPIRHSLKTALGSVLAIAILIAPGVASAQSLFGAPAPDTSSAPESATSPAVAPTKAKKAATKKTPVPVAVQASDTSSADASSPPPFPAQEKKHNAKKTPAKPAAVTTAAKINVANNRDATLVELSVTSTTVKDAKPQVVAHDLKSGQKASSPLAKKGGCIYEVSGNFDDQSRIEQSAVDFCKDANLNLVE